MFLGVRHTKRLGEKVNDNPFVSGMYIWTGFDYMGEPTPYWFPARSSYFGVVDLAGFPKDAYYFYQSVWTDKTMLHVFPTGIGKKGSSSIFGLITTMPMKPNFS